MYFRFYDPRVLRIFLPTCDAAQLKEFFGPVAHFICEDEDPAFGLVFSLEQGKLKTEKVPVKELFPQMMEEKEQAETPLLPLPPKEKSFSDQPLEYARFEGEAETFRQYVSGLSMAELGELFSSVTHYYVQENPEVAAAVFSLSEKNNTLIVADVSSEEMAIRLEQAEKKQKENEERYSASIRDKKKPVSGPVDAPATEEKKSKAWSWLKI